MEIMYIKPDKAEFKAMVRYIAADEVVTIPRKVSRELGIRLGDMVKIRLRKTMEKVS